MIAWKKICCATDFSEPSRLAMEKAADLAKQFEGELTLVHVLTPPIPAASDVLVSSRGIAEVAAQEAEDLLPLWRAEAELRAGLQVKAVFLSGDPAAEIVSHARDESVDLIVIGTRGRSGISRVVLGSVAERVVRRSPCPVLVVHDHDLRVREGVAEEAAQYM